MNNNQTQPTEPAIIVSPVPSSQKLFTHFFIVGGIVLLLLVAVGGYFLGQKSKTNSPSIPSPTTYPQVTTQPTIDETVNGKTNTNLDQNQIPTPTTIPTTSLTYNLPSGWRTVQEDSKTFEIGYDPRIYSVSTTNNNSILLAKVGTHYSVSLLPYNGGSRHQFIYDKLAIKDPNQDKMPTYHEKEYIYNGWSCLVLYGLALSASGDIHGMCAVDSSHAFLLESIPDEQIIRTIKLLQNP